jgi:hypothetical protein
VIRRSLMPPFGNTAPTSGELVQPRQHQHSKRAGRASGFRVPRGSALFRLATDTRPRVNGEPLRPGGHLWWARRLHRTTFELTFRQEEIEDDERPRCGGEELGGNQRGPS